MKGALSYAAAVLDATLDGPDASFVGVSTDTRTLKPGNLFVALKGDRFDGHDYLGAAQAAGAAGAVIGRSMRPETDLTLIRSGDTRRAMGTLARAWRDNFDLRVVAITGSNGKTTVKEMVAAICAETGAGAVHHTQGNYNNEIGVPLTLFGLNENTRYAVIEMGANHPGEIAYLTEIARPDVGLITNVAPAHLEGFGSLEGVARAKGELYEHMDKSATAVINADDNFAGQWTSMAAPRPIVRFGSTAFAEVRAEVRDESVYIHLPGGSFELELRIPGRHNIQNALAASACGLALGLSATDIRAGLKQMQAVRGRLELKQSAAGYTVLDDSYNANPGSLAAAVEVLVEQPGEPWVVLGVMGELGRAANALHAQAGEDLLRAGVARLFTLGSQAQASAQAFGRGAQHFDDSGALIGALQSEIHDRVCCLIKGSRAARMERVVDALLGARRGLQCAGKGG